MEVVCTECCGLISLEKPMSEGSGRPVTMLPGSGCTISPQSHPTRIWTPQVPWAFLADSLHPGAQLLHPIQIFFLLMFAQHVRCFGSVAMYSTDIGELAHKEQIKEGYRRPNKNQAAEHILVQ